LDYNKTYLLSISSVFYVVAIISIIQLLICCFAEYKRLKQPSLAKAFRITTQKMLYFVVFLASLLRAVFFSQPESAMPPWSYYLMTAFYPLLMTCASLIVCFWAEVSQLTHKTRKREKFIDSSLSLTHDTFREQNLFTHKINPIYRHFIFVTSDTRGNF
jgi:von Hippel-Lindau disease tumor supressor